MYAHDEEESMHGQGLKIKATSSTSKSVKHCVAAMKAAHVQKIVRGIIIIVKILLSNDDLNYVIVYKIYLFLSNPFIYQMDAYLLILIDSTCVKFGLHEFRVDVW